MKAILEFNLPDDLRDFNFAVNAKKLRDSLCDLDDHLRSRIKYAPDDMSEIEFNVLKDVRNKLHQIMSENNLTFDLVE